MYTAISKHSFTGINKPRQYEAENILELVDLVAERGDSVTELFYDFGNGEHHFSPLGVQVFNYTVEKTWDANAAAIMDEQINGWDQYREEPQKRLGN